MEGAKPKQIGAGTAQIHILPHNLLNGIAGCKLRQKRRGKSHRDASFHGNFIVHNEGQTASARGAPLGEAAGASRHNPR